MEKNTLLPQKLLKLNLINNNYRTESKKMSTSYEIKHYFEFNLHI